MYHERTDHRPEYISDRPGMFQEAGTGRHRAPTDVFSAPPVPPDLVWDPAEELAFMLQNAMEEQQRPRIPEAREEASVTDPAPGTPLSNLQEITAELPPLRRVSGGHRKVRDRPRMSRLRTVSYFIAGMTAGIAAAVSLFGGMVAYDPLTVVATPRMEGGIADWWPLLVYGPWLVAALSVLRAALHQRRAVHSWCMVLLFSSIGVLLCVDQTPKTVTDNAVAALPCLASLTCFQQLVRQITLTRPPRRTLPRHRLGRPTPDVRPAEPSTDETPSEAPPAPDRQRSPRADQPAVDRRTAPVKSRPPNRTVGDERAALRRR